LQHIWRSREWNFAGIMVPDRQWLSLCSW